MYKSMICFCKRKKVQITVKKAYVDIRKFLNNQVSQTYNTIYEMGKYDYCSIITERSKKEKFFLHVFNLQETSKLDVTLGVNNKINVIMKYMEQHQESVKKDDIMNLYAYIYIL